LRVRLQMATSEAACGSANKFGTWQRTANHEQPTRPTRSGSAVGMLDVDAGIEFTSLPRTNQTQKRMLLLLKSALNSHHHNARSFPSRASHSSGPVRATRAWRWNRLDF